MIFIQIDDNYRLINKNNNPSLLSKEVLETGYVVDFKINDPEEKMGKFAQIFVNPHTKEVWYEYFDIPLTPEEELKQTKEELGNVIFDNALKTAQIASLEQEVGGLLAEVAFLKMGGNE